LAFNLRLRSHKQHPNRFNLTSSSLFRRWKCSMYHFSLSRTHQSNF